jgi:hypothetical protein
MSYPVILCGDHAQYERKYAEEPAREKPFWPLPSFDARDWSSAFCKIAKAQGHDLDQEWVTGWFANALMRGWDEHAVRCAKPKSFLTRLKIAFGVRG